MERLYLLEGSYSVLESVCRRKAQRIIKKRNIKKSVCRKQFSKCFCDCFYHQKMQIDCQSIHQSHFLRFSTYLKIQTYVVWLNQDVRDYLISWTSHILSTDRRIAALCVCIPWRHRYESKCSIYQLYSLLYTGWDCDRSNRTQWQALNYQRSLPSAPPGSPQPRPKVVTPPNGHGHRWKQHVATVTAVLWDLIYLYSTHKHSRSWPLCFLQSMSVL